MFVRMLEFFLIFEHLMGLEVDVFVTVLYLRKCKGNWFFFSLFIYSLFNSCLILLLPYRSLDSSSIIFHHPFGTFNFFSTNMWLHREAEDVSTELVPFLPWTRCSVWWPEPILVWTKEYSTHLLNYISYWISMHCHYIHNTPAIAVIAVPVNSTMSPVTIHSTNPPRVDNCFPITKSLPSLEAKYGPRTQWAEPVTGSSLIPASAEKEKHQILERHYQGVSLEHTFGPKKTRHKVWIHRKALLSLFLDIWVISTTYNYPSRITIPCHQGGIIQIFVPYISKWLSANLDQNIPNLW